jgi:hypothetical protein
MKKLHSQWRLFMAGDEGFEPPISGPEPGALPLGQSPVSKLYFTLKRGSNY